MGGCIGSIAGSCLASCACSACTAGCSGCDCLASPKAAAYVYIVFQFVATIAALALRYSGVDLNVGYDVGMSNNQPTLCTNTSGFSCDDIAYDICNSEACEGYWAVYRISFAVASFFFVMMILTSVTSKFAVDAHCGFWSLKGLLFAGVMAGILFAPNNVLAYYAWIARFIAPLFLIYQATCYIDFGYNLNEKLLMMDELEKPLCCCTNRGSKYQGIMFLVSLTLIFGSIALIGVMYRYFPASCAFNGLACTTTLIFGVINTVVSITPLSHEKASLFVSALIFAYNTYLCYASVSAMPVPSCNAMIGNETDTELPWLILSCVIAALTIAYFAFRMGGKASAPRMGSNAMTGGAPEEAESGGADTVTVKVAGDKDGKGEEEKEEVEPQSFLAYHFVMFIVAVYMGMMLTDWGSPAASVNQKYNLGYASAWLQMTVNWICSLLYFWTLIAARVCPNRDFS